LIPAEALLALLSRNRGATKDRLLSNAEHRLRETVQLRAIVTQLDDFAARVRLDALPWIERRQIIRTLIAKIDIDETGPPSSTCPPSTQ
jgi:hypothetical protein